MSLRQFFIGNNLVDQSDIWQRVDICPVCVSRVVAAIMTPRGNAITRPAAERLARTIAPDRINTNTSATGCIQKCGRERRILMQSVHNFRPQNTLQEIYKDKFFKNISEPGPAYFYPPSSCFLFLILLVLCSHHSSALMSMILKSLSQLSPSYKLTRVTPSDQSYRPLYPLNMYFQACTDMENSARTSLVQDLQPRGTMCLRYGQKLSKRIQKWYVIRETSLDNVVQYRNGVQNAIIQRMGLVNRSNQGEGR